MFDTEGNAVQPEKAALNGFSYVMFRGRDDDGVVCTCITMQPGQVDRYPCGTSFRATMAAPHFDGQVLVYDVMTTHSTFGGVTPSDSASVG